MYCEKCGKENSDRADYCSNCGYILKESKTTQPSQAHIPNYLGWAIAVTILCSWLFGIIAIIYSVRVGEKLRIGDYAGALDASKKAKMWCWITFVISIAVIAIGIMIAVVAFI